MWDFTWPEYGAWRVADVIRGGRERLWEGEVWRGVEVTSPELIWQMGGSGSIRIRPKFPEIGMNFIEPGGVHREHSGCVSTRGSGEHSEHPEASPEKARTCRASFGWASLGGYPLMRNLQPATKSNVLPWGLESG